MGRLSESIGLLEHVRDLAIARFGPDHPDTLKILHTLALSYWNSNQLDKSVPLFEDVLKRQEARFGRQHPDTQHTVANLGVNYKAAGRLKEAIPLLEEAHESAKRFPAHRWVGGQLIDGYRKAGENAKLADLLRERMTKARESLPKDSPELARVLVQFGLILLQQMQWTEAEPLLRECLAIREKTQPDLWSTSNTESMLGGALLGQKRYADAEPLLLKGYEGMKKSGEDDPAAGQHPHPRGPRPAHRPVHRHEQAGRRQKWQAERAKYPKAAALLGEKK